MKVAIGVHGRFHAFELAAALHARGSLAQLATTYPAAVARRFLPPGIRLRTAPILELLRRAHGRLRLGRAPDRFIAARFGAFAARTLPADADVFVGWSSAALEGIERVHAQGGLAVVERGSTHILHQRDVLADAYARRGLTFAGIDPGIVERELAEYDAADLIAVPTAFAAETFVARGVDAGKLVVNPYGVDAHYFAVDDRPARAHPTVLFVGAAGVQKGAPELLAAYRPHRRAASLVLAGPVERGWAPTGAPGVRFLGAIRRADVRAALRDADIFCLPSHQEGLSLSLLQAMAAGLPVIATRESGAGEVISGGTEGLLVDAGDTDAISAALGRLIDDPAARARMGRAAREKAATLTWEAYGERALAAYAGARGNATPAGRARGAW